MRWSAAKGFLKPIRSRANLKVVTGANASRILFEDRKAVGVAYSENGVPREARANGEVILSAGAFGSPQLLQVSGIGPGALLRQNGVAVLHDLPGVGENLQDHWMMRVLHRVSNTKTFNQAVDTPLRKALAGLRYIATREGPLSAPVSLMTAFVKSRPDVVAPDIQLQISIASYEKVGGPLHPFPGIGSSVCICRPSSRGHLRIKSTDAAVPPAVLNNFMATQDDRRIAVEGLRVVRKIMAGKAISRFAPEEIQPTSAVETEEQISAFARANASTVFHPVGTCMMGRGEMSVVDERLKVRGIDGLRVVDASIMPTLTSGNTNGPTFMIAEKGADMIKADERR
jgi:choline dehydrogenase